MNNLLDRLEKAQTESEVNVIIDKGCLNATPHTISFLMKVKYRNLKRVSCKTK